MKKDLTSSTTNRQNILNNSYALEQIESNLELGGLYWQDEALFSKAKVSALLEIDIRTVERYLKNYNEELVKNGYRVLKGEELKSERDSEQDSRYCFRCNGRKIWWAYKVYQSKR